MNRQNRPITDQERAWLLQGLATLPTGESAGGGSWMDMDTGETLPLDEPIDPARYLAQIDDLRVVGMCDCGEPNCHTVKFQHCRRGFQSTLVMAATDDGRMLIICVDRETNMLAELEII